MVVGQNKKLWSDPADSPAASFESSQLPDSVLDEFKEVCDLSDVDLAKWLDHRITLLAEERSSTMFKQVVSIMLETEDPKRMAWVVAFAAGLECTLGVDGKQVAKNLHMTKQAFNKAVNDLVDVLDLSRNRNLMCQEQRHSQRAAQHRKNHTIVTHSTFPTKRQMSTRSLESIWTRFLLWRARLRRVKGWSDNLERLTEIERVMRPIVCFYFQIKAVLPPSPGITASGAGRIPTTSDNSCGAG
jgi:hypothetical protein